VVFFQNEFDPGIFRPKFRNDLVLEGDFIMKLVDHKDLGGVADEYIDIECNDA